MTLKFIALIIPGFLIYACHNAQNQNYLDWDSYSKYREKGNSITAQAQYALLSRVSEAINKGGSAFAIEFCNVKAMDITDSLSNEYDCSISRVTVKNRNPANEITTSGEKQLWDYFLALNENRMIHDTLVVSGRNLVYYKPILTSMQTCLNCHGPIENINKDTYDKILELYPNDKATGYGLNELRGLWKVEFEPGEKNSEKGKN